MNSEVLVNEDSGDEDDEFEIVEESDGSETDYESENDNAEV